MSSSKRFVLVLCATAFGYALGSNAKRVRAELPVIASTAKPPGDWVAGSLAPSGAVTAVPVPAVRLNRTQFAHDEARREWYRLGALDEPQTSRPVAVVILPAKQNSEAVAYLVAEDGRAVPVPAVEILRK